MINFKEIPGKMQCPCGSGQLYKNCCKKKNFTFEYNGENIIKKIPIHDDLMPELIKARTQFKEYYGRIPGKNDYVMSFVPIYKDELLLQAIYMFREMGIPENKIYAYYKTDGLLPCDLNIDLLPEAELEEYASFCNEFDDCINSEDKGNKGMNSIKYVLSSNSYIKEQVEYTIQAIISSLNDFIHRHSENDSILEYQMSTELDYCIFSALKTVKTLQSIEQLKEKHLVECIYALTRGIFENYMYLCNINNDPLLFSEKLLPRVDEDNYTFAETPDGKTNYNKVINKNTGEKIVQVKISDLRNKLPYDTDRELYTVFYQTACRFVHVDVMSAKSYFSAEDPYDEIDRSLIAALITAVLAELLLLQISQHKNVQEQYKKDALFLCMNNLNERLAMCLQIASVDSEHPNVILDLLIKRIQE